MPRPRSTVEPTREVARRHHAKAGHEPGLVRCRLAAANHEELPVVAVAEGRYRGEADAAHGGQRAHALGARQVDIRNQFFLEAFAVTVTGGLLGIVMGVGIAKGVAAYAGWKTIVTLSSIALAVGVSAGVGLAFGSYPAMRAARLDPVEALRYE
jgi:predicted lysophospholipase L1 biosynthesis ABC-type transport system permease subunit